MVRSAQFTQRVDETSAMLGLFPFVYFAFDHEGSLPDLT